MDDRIIENAIVQVNEKGQEGWIGCLVQVSEIKEWGVQGWVQIPASGQAYIRLKWDEVDYIGQAVMITVKEE